MSIKDEALRLLESLPDDAGWPDVLRAVSAGAGASGFGGRGVGMVRELRAPWGAAGEAPLPGTDYTEGGSMRDFDVLVEQDQEGTYVASVPALRGCHTQASTLDQLMERVLEAIELCLEVGAPAPEGRFLGVRRVSVPA